MHHILSLIVDTLYPLQCVGCEAYEEMLCDTCSKSFTPKPLVCIVCMKTSNQGMTHKNCKTKHSPSQLLYIGEYHNEVLKALIHNLKYGKQRTIALSCAKLLQDITKEYPNHSLTFVPIHAKKLKRRGFNQSEEIAKALGKLTKNKVVQTLSKVTNTKDQIKLTGAQRKLNLQNTFKANPHIKNKSYILIDDVCTTGSTLLECSKTLLEAGATEVICLTLAKD